MSNKTITYMTRRGEKVTVDSNSVVNHRALWSPSYHLADLMLAELGIDSSNTKIRNKFVGNIKASMSALHDGAVTAGEIEGYKKVKKVPKALADLIQLDKFDYAFKADGIDIKDYPMFAAPVAKKTPKKARKPRAAKPKAAVLKPNGFGKVSATDPIDAAEKRAKLDAFMDMAEELGIDLAALTKS